MPDEKETALAGAVRHCDYNSPNDIAERWQRVSSRYRCPICNHSSWCLISNDGAVAGCMRIDRGSFKTTPTRGGDVHIHRLRNDSNSSHCTATQARPAPRNPPAAAPIDQRHAAYTSFLEQLTVSPAHAGYLVETKRLSHETVTRNLYATCPAPQTVSKLCMALAAEFDLSAVPGFHRAGKGWTFNARQGELLIPCRDHRGRIAALLRRTGSDPKYVWASSSRHDGPSSGAPTHFALPCMAEITGTLIITEGPLKADAIAERLQCAVVGISGVASFGERFGSDLRSALPAAKLIYVAFDADEQRNPHVRSALVRLMLSLRVAGYVAVVLRWDEVEGKGLDDVLLGAGV